MRGDDCRTGGLTGLYSRWVHEARDADGCQVMARVELDNGAAIPTVARALSSSNPSVVSVIDAGWVKGIAPGTATLTGTYEGLTGTLALRVDP